MIKSPSIQVPAREQEDLFCSEHILQLLCHGSIHKNSSEGLGGLVTTMAAERLRNS